MKAVFVTIIVVIVGALVALGISRRDLTSSVPSSPESASDGNEMAREGVGIGDKAPDFELRDYTGNTVKLSDYGGKPVFINFWASWCPFCVDELPLMAKIQKEHDKEYVTLAINRGEDIKTASQYTDQLNVTTSMLFLMDPQDAQYSRFQLFAMPSSIFIDKDGIIRDKFFGPLREKDLIEKLSKIL